MSQLYPYGKLMLRTGVSGNPLFASGTLTLWRALLLWEGGQFNPTHRYVADVVAGSLEMSGGSYARQNLASVQAALIGSYTRFTSNPVTFSALPAGHTAVGMVLYFHTGTDASDGVYAYIDGGTSPAFPYTTTGADLIVSPNLVDGWDKL